MTDDVLDERTFRPARLSSALALVVTLAALAVLTSGEPLLRRFTAVAVVVGVFSAMTIALVDRNGVVLRTIGVGVLPVAALSFVGLAVFVLRDSMSVVHLGYTLGIYTAALGGALGVTGLDRTDAPTNSVSRAILLTSLLVPLVGVGLTLHRWRAVVELGAITGDVFNGILSFILVPPSSGPSAFVFFLCCAVAGGTAYSALRALTTHGRDLLTKEQRETTDRLVERLSLIFFIGIPALLLFGVGVGAAIAVGAFGILPPSIATVLLAIMFSSTLRMGLVAIGVGGMIVWGSVRVLVSIRRLSGEYVLRSIVPLLGGLVGVGCLVSAGLAFGIGSDIRQGLEMTPLASVGELLNTPLLVAVAVIIALVGFVVWIATIAVLREFRVLPPNAPGMALATGGILLATLVEPPGLVIATIGVAAMVVVWDSSVRAVELGDQLGRHSPTRLGELVHISGTAAVAIAGGVVVLVVNHVANTIQPDVSSQLALVGLLAALLGTSLLLAVLKS